MKEKVAPRHTSPSARKLSPWRQTIRATVARPTPSPELVLAVQTLEREEVLAGVRLVEPDAVIPDVVDGLAPLLLDAELYLRLGLSRGDLLGVAQ